MVYLQRECVANASRLALVDTALNVIEDGANCFGERLCPRR